jgi:tRNA(fMet)-specific endonuclease VapC
VTRFLLDTDTLWHLLREPAGAVARRVDELLVRLKVLPIDDGVARAYADARRALERAGTPIGPNDLWIAAHALAEGLVVVTGSVREFRRVVGLAVEDWREALGAASPDV